MLTRLCRVSLKRPFIAERKFIRCASIIISNNDHTLDQNNRTCNRLCVVSTINVPVRYRRFDNKNDPKDNDNPEGVEESQNVRPIYDVKSNPDSTSIATIQVPDELPYIPLVTIAKPPLYPRLFRIVEVCIYKYISKMWLLTRYYTIILFNRLVIPS